jgi:hypothetical protein
MLKSPSEMDAVGFLAQINIARRPTTRQIQSS